MSEAGDVSEGYVQLLRTELRVKAKEGDVHRYVEVVFKILLKQEEDTLQSVRFQLSNDQELDFLFEVTYDESGFSEVKRRQGLEVEFSDFPNVVHQQLVALVQQRKDGSERPRFKAILTSEDDKAWEEDDGYEADEEEEAGGEKKFLIIYQNLDFCRVQVFKFGFERCELRKTSRISQARYDELVAKLKSLETEYKDIFKRIQRTAPKLLEGLRTDGSADQ
jgi:hypothetical protein